MHNACFKMLLAAAFAIFTTTARSQKETHSHDLHKLELGVANSLVYFAGEEEFAYGLHIHLIRNIEHTRLGFGLAYERIFDEHRHNTIGLAGSYTILDGLHVSLTPGLVFEDKDPSDLRFALHAETSYDFDFGHIHLGPLLEFAADPEDYHVSLGLHLGYGF